MTVAGVALASIGATFALVAAVGLLRLPDVLSRLHAATKATTLGTIGLLSGTALLIPAADVAVKVAVAIAFQILTAPIAAHVIGRATYRTGVPHQADIDELAEGPEDGATTDPTGPSG